MTHSMASSDQDVLGVVDHPGGRRLADQAGVVEHLRDELAGMGGLQPRQIGADHPAEQFKLHVADDAVADAIDQGRLHDLGDRPDQGVGDDRQRDDDHRAGLGLDQQVVHRRFEQLDQQARQGRDHRRADQGDGDSLPARLEVGPPDARRQLAVGHFGWRGDGHGVGNRP
jgi:hypothetical protein